MGWWWNFELFEFWTGKGGQRGEKREKERITRKRTGQDRPPTSFGLKVALFAVNLQHSLTRPDIQLVVGLVVQRIHEKNWNWWSLGQTPSVRNGRDLAYTPFTRSSKHRADVEQTSSKTKHTWSIAYMKQTSNNHQAIIEQTSSRRQAINTWIMNTFARCLLDVRLVV